MGQFQRGGHRGRRHQQPAPKPFAFVPLPNSVDRKRPIGHERYHEKHITGQIHGTIEALSPIHIGSGIIDLGQNVDLIKTAVRTGTNIVIPGSSLKGAIRSVLEAISKSCVCKIANNTKVGTIFRFKNKLKQFCECSDKSRLCVACRMFGAMEFQGNIAIQDAPHIEGKIVTKLVPPLHRPQCYKTDNRNRPMRKFYMHGEVASGRTPIEACEVGSKFRFVVNFNNLTKAELGLFFTALGHHSEYPFKLKIGGAKPVCFGSIDFQIDEIHVDKQTPDKYLDWDFNRVSVKKDKVKEGWMKGCITEASNSLIQRDLLTEVAKILQYPNTRNCPSGTY